MISDGDNGQASQFPGVKEVVVDVLKNSKACLKREEIVYMVRTRTKIEEPYVSGAVSDSLAKLKKEGVVSNPRRGFWVLSRD